MSDVDTIRDAVARMRVNALRFGGVSPDADDNAVLAQVCREWIAYQEVGAIPVAVPEQPNRDGRVVKKGNSMS